MKPRLLLIIGLLVIPFLSAFSQRHSDIDKKTDKIKLVNLGEKPCFVYENLVSIIYIDKDALIDCVNKRLDNRKLCDLRRKNYKIILDDLTRNDSSLYVIYPAEAPSEQTKDMEQETGFFPLDFYSKLVCFNISKHYTAPYGYKVETDTSNLIHSKKYFEWMISDPVLKGQAKIYNKKTRKFEKEVIHEVVHFDGLHGGDLLKFSDDSLFFIVETFSDVIMMDIECDEEFQKGIK